MVQYNDTTRDEEIANSRTRLSSMKFPLQRIRICILEHGFLSKSIMACAFSVFLQSNNVLYGDEPPDLSKLSYTQKENGFGQFQASKLEPSAEPSSSKDSSERLERERAKRLRAEEQLRIERMQRQQVMLGAGAGMVAGGMVLGNSLQQNRFGQAPNGLDFNDLNDPSLPRLDVQRDVPEYQVADPISPTAMNFRPSNVVHPIGVKVNSLFFRDLSRFDAQIVDGINSNQLGWSGAAGIESSFYLNSSGSNDFGFNLGFALVRGDDESRASSVQLLYTNPNIGFAPSPFLSHRDTGLATVEGNITFSTTNFGQSAIGLRWFHVDDSLENQVLPDGLFHRIETTSNSFLLQYTFAPTIELKRLQVDSLFQIGVGPMIGKSSTRLGNFVGGPAGLPSEIVLDRITGTAFFKGQLGLVLPIRKWFAARTGVQLLAQTDVAESAAQISHIDFAQQRYHLRTESMVLGGLFAGVELRR